MRITFTAVAEPSARALAILKVLSMGEAARLVRVCLKGVGLHVTFDDGTTGVMPMSQLEADVGGRVRRAWLNNSGDVRLESLADKATIPAQLVRYRIDPQFSAAFEWRIDSSYTLVGAALKHARTAAGLSPDGLAQAAGARVQDIMAIESGSLASMRLLLKLAGC
jgi:hypothetical protein